MRDVHHTARPGHPGADGIGFVVIALDGRAGRIDAATVAAPRDHIVVRSRLIDRWRRSMVRRDAVVEVDRPPARRTSC